MWKNNGKLALFGIFILSTSLLLGKKAAHEGNTGGNATNGTSTGDTATNGGGGDSAGESTYPTGTWTFGDGSSFTQPEGMDPKLRDSRLTWSKKNIAATKLQKLAKNMRTSMIASAKKMGFSEDQLVFSDPQIEDNTGNIVFGVKLKKGVNAPKYVDGNDPINKEAERERDILKDKFKYPGAYVSVLQALRYGDTDYPLELFSVALFPESAK